MNNLPNDYFIGIDDQLLDFLEKQAEDCIKEVEQSNTVNRENGYKLLGIQIVGIGSSFLLLTQNNQPDFMTYGIGLFTLFWAACAIYLVHGVLSVQVRALLSSPPADLYPEVYKALGPEHYVDLASRGFKGTQTPLSVLRRFRLVNLQSTAEELCAVNERIRSKLERARIATILTPVYAIVISVIAYLSS
ncbi:hypothetical protein UYK19_002913 [Enterobacter hormaechei]|nr:hypothetical protein [Enterobacter hormaechei]